MMLSNDMPSTVYFADIAVETLEPSKTLPSKFRRMLKRVIPPERIKGRKIGIKMHYGGDIGYSTIHPIFIRILVEELRNADATDIYVMDNRVEDGLPRGYTPEVLGCKMVSTFGNTSKYLYREEIGFKGLDFVEFGGEAVDCDFFIDLSHVKGHGDCAYGGAIKNISMGTIPLSSRTKIHHLEGGIHWDNELCTYCQKCVEICPNNAITFKDEGAERSIFFHNCTYCQHCVLTCPDEALTLTDRKFEDFYMGMALVADRFLRKFDPKDMLFINVLTGITMLCDCWGMTTPSLVPDIGILASDDISAIEMASLDMVKTENLLPNALPKGRELLEGDGHLFERIHGKDPYLLIKQLKEIYGGSMEYEVEVVR